MKTSHFKILFITASLVLLLAAAIPVLSQSIDNPVGIPSFKDLAKKIGKAMQAIGGAIGSIMIIMGAYQYITSAGNEEKVKTAHRLILWAVIGLSILLIGENWVTIFCSIITCS